MKNKKLTKITLLKKILTGNTVFLITVAVQNVNKSQKHRAGKGLIRKTSIFINIFINY